MDDMAMPPRMVGDVYLNLRTNPIRVGNVVEGGKQVGYSGDFYRDCHEISWEEVAKEAGMPSDEVERLKGREYTTVTGRLRRVSNFSWIGLEDAVRTNGATKLILNFVQYLDWNDRNLRGGREAFEKLSHKSRSFIDKIEEAANVPVVLIGTGADHEDMISLL
jgi:adenylosuccinate synthase